MTTSVGMVCDCAQHVGVHAPARVLPFLSPLALPPSHARVLVLSLLLLARAPSPCRRRRPALRSIARR